MVPVQVPGSVPPGGTLRHIPPIPGTAHDMHVAPHAALQHMRSTQSVLVHWFPTTQGVPFG